MKIKYWILIVIGVVFSLGIGVMLGSEDSNTNTSSFIRTGEEGKLYVEGSSVVPVCKTLAYFNELIDAAVAKDEIGYKNLLMGSKCYVTSILDNYGKVLVLENTLGATKFRFTYPTALHYSEVAWTNSEFIISI